MAAIGTRAKAQSGDGPQAKQLKQKILTTMDADTHKQTHTHMCPTHIHVQLAFLLWNICPKTKWQQQQNSSSSRAEKHPKAIRGAFEMPTHTHTHICRYAICVCVCVCVSVRAISFCLACSWANFIDNEVRATAAEAATNQPQIGQRWFPLKCTPRTPTWPRFEPPTDQRSRQAVCSL